MAAARFRPPACYTFNSIRAPVSSHICKYLCSVGKQIIKQHTDAIKSNHFLLPPYMAHEYHSNQMKSLIWLQKNHRWVKNLSIDVAPGSRIQLHCAQMLLHQNLSLLRCGLPCIRSRKISVIFTTNSQSLSFCSLDELFAFFVGKIITFFTIFLYPC